jgi:hypothetical protein
MAGLFGSPHVDPAPPPPDPIRISDPNDPAVIAARHAKEQQDIGSRQGHDSTILSQDGGSVPNPVFSRTTLG